MSRPSSVFLSQESSHTLFHACSSQTLHRRKGSRLIVRADAVSINALLSNNEILSGGFMCLYFMKVFLKVMLYGSHALVNVLA